MTTAIGAIWWGFNKPGCFLFATVEPNGRLRVIADLKFQQKSEEAVADLVAVRAGDLGVRLTSSYAHVDLFDLSNPETRKAIPVEPPADVFRRSGLSLTPVTGDEAHGWQRLHDYLRDAPDGKPWLTFAPECKTLLRTLPTLVQRDTDPDLIDRAGPGFAAHALRILVSARPSVSALERRKPGFAFLTLGWLKSLDDTPDPRALLRRYD